MRQMLKETWDNVEAEVVVYGGIGAVLATIGLAGVGVVCLAGVRPICRQEKREP